MELLHVADVVAREKSIDRDEVLTAMEQAIQKAGRSKYGPLLDIRAKINRANGEVMLARYQTVVETVEDEHNQLTLAQAQKRDPAKKVGDTFVDVLPPIDFGRIAAQTAKQVILQRIRDVERESKYEEYAGKEGEIVTGIIQQTDQRYTLLDLGRVEALLPQAEQVQNERYEHGSRLKAYIVEVRKTAKGPQIVVSRPHPGLVKRLFELAVPEIADGVVELKAIAREPGHRTKIAVASNENNVDPVGACVGARGSRVRMVVNELRGEKVDIVPYNDDPAEFVMKALAPARVREVRIHPDTGTAEVIVPDFQLSLAIGKEGQNARLAARLTGWRVDIRSETEFAEEEAEMGYEEEEVSGRCAAILSNGRRCPNASLPGSRYCGLPAHQALEAQEGDHVSPPEEAPAAEEPPVEEAPVTEEPVEEPAVEEPAAEGAPAEEPPVEEAAEERS